MNKDKKNRNGFLGKKMTRKQAIKKAGITALTTATLLFLETKESAAASGKPTDPPPRGRGNDRGGGND